MLLLTGAASAAPTWLGALDLSSVSTFAGEANVAVDSQGEALAVWVETGGLLEASVHPPDGSWQPPKTVASDAGFGDQVAFDANGDATAIWDNGSNVETATLPAGASAWTAPAAISPGSANSPELAVNSQGAAVAVWTVPVSGAAASTSIVQAAFRPSATGTWQAPVQLSTTPVFTSPTTDLVAAPEVALDSQGDATTVWTQTIGSNEPVVWAGSRLGVSGIWQTPATLSDATVAAGGAQVKLDAAGRSTAIWTDTNGLHAADHPAGGSWSNPVTVSGVAGDENPALAVGPHGAATAVWDQPAGSGVDVAEAVARPSAGTWQTPVALSTPQASSQPPDPKVGLDSDGDAVAVWDAFNGSTHVVAAANRPATGSWPAPGGATTLSGAATTGVGEQLAVDPAGNAAVVWTFFDGTTSLAQAAGYDGAGPLLNGLTVPASGTPGVPVKFSVSPLDAWSAVASTTWSFGDGQTGGAQSLTHTYASAGKFTVKVTSADTLGNSTSQSRTITIAAPNPPTPPPKLTSVSEKHKKWRENSKARKPAGKHGEKPPPVGTSFSFTVDQTADVTFFFSRTAPGRKVDGRCQAATKRNHKHPKCHVTRAEGTLTESVAAGHHTVPFRGRIGKRKLPLGAYTLELAATNSSKQHSRTSTLKFTIAN